MLWIRPQRCVLRQVDLRAKRGAEWQQDSVVRDGVIRVRRNGRVAGGHIPGEKEAVIGGQLARKDAITRGRQSLAPDAQRFVSSAVCGCQIFVLQLSQHCAQPTDRQTYVVPVVGQSGGLGNWSSSAVSGMRHDGDRLVPRGAAGRSIRSIRCNRI